MSSEHPCMLDTNVPMYAVGSEHPYRDACQWVMKESVEGRLAAVIDTELLQEVLHRYGSQGRIPDAVRMVTDLTVVVQTVYPVGLADIERATILFERLGPQGVRSRDVIHAAIMLNNGLTEILTADTHFDLVPGIRRVDPLQMYQANQPAQP